MLFEIRRKPGVQLDQVGLGPILVRFRSDGLAVDPEGRTALPEACAQSARAYPKAFDVRPVPPVEPKGTDGRGGGVPAFWRIDRGVLLPPTVDNLTVLGCEPNVAKLIAECEAEAAALGLFPYGSRARLPLPAAGDAALEHSSGREDVADPNAGAHDGGAPASNPASSPPSEVTATDSALAEGAPAPPGPPAPPTYDQAIEASLGELLVKHGGGGRLRDIADSLGLRATGQSKAELAEAIRKSAGEGPEAQLRVHDLLVGGGAGA